MNELEPPSSSGKVILDLRGAKRIPIEREALMELPESVLLCLFPNGVVLSPQRPLGSRNEDEGEDVYYVDFDAECLEFVLHFFSRARDDFYGPPEGPRRDLSDAAPPTQHASMQNPLFLKQAIIVLREELEYFAIPPKGVATLASDGKGVTSHEPASEPKSVTQSTLPFLAPISGADKKETPVTAVTAGDFKGDVKQGLHEHDEELPRTDEAGKPNKALLKLKLDCGAALLERKSIFTALQRNVNRENNVAEQHLIDMLCMSGFEREDLWGFRSLEPNRCCIASIALVLLKTGITHPPITPSPTSSAPDSTTGASTLGVSEPSTASSISSKPSVTVNSQQLATAQKLLLFWRKPARKCWWDATDLTLQDGREIKVWARRVWTLELSLI